MDKNDLESTNRKFEASYFIAKKRISMKTYPDLLSMKTYPDLLSMKRYPDLLALEKKHGVDI